MLPFTTSAMRRVAVMSADPTRPCGPELVRLRLIVAGSSEMGVSDVTCRPARDVAPEDRAPNVRRGDRSTSAGGLPQSDGHGETPYRI